MTMLRHLFAILALPFTVTVVVPYLLLRNAGSGASLPGQVGGIEDAGLERRFGTEYADYRRHVPRWIPRLSPWQGKV